MISEVTFSKGHSSFWQEYFPWLNYYVKSLNSNDKLRVLPALEYDEDAKYRSINNFIAFNHFKNIKDGAEHSIELSFKEVRGFIKKFPRSNIESYSMNDLNEKIIKFQVERLIKKYGRDAEIYPSFPGCGVLSCCYGDILKDDILVEIKAGKRPIQTIDFKQLITYVALNWVCSTKKHNICKLEIFNPRLGLVWNSDISDFFQAVSYLPKENVLDQLCKYMVELSEETVV